jgi:hypothetical protein
VQLVPRVLVIFVHTWTAWIYIYMYTLYHGICGTNHSFDLTINNWYGNDRADVISRNCAQDMKTKYKSRSNNKGIKNQFIHYQQSRGKNVASSLDTYLPQHDVRMVAFRVLFFCITSLSSSVLSFFRLFPAVFVELYKL